MRSNPDGNPYNNWSYPGNTNPYTGKVAPGNPSTYLDNLSNEKAPSTSSNLTSSETSSEAEKELIAMGVKSEYVSKYKEKKDNLAKKGIKKYKHWVGEYCKTRTLTVTDTRHPGLTTKDYSGFKNGPSPDYSDVYESQSILFLLPDLYVKILEVHPNGWVKIELPSTGQFSNQFSSTGFNRTAVGYVDGRYLD